MSRPLRVAMLLFLGSLLLQSAWILTLPPFRGTDEFDHAYRAAAVADGQWRAPRAPAVDGRGQLVIVPRSLVLAAHPVCASYGYTGPANCSPVRDVGGGRVEVASAAASYNPLFYWVIGTAARPFTGAHALYAMRISAALLCALMVGLTGWVTTLWARSSWPLAALVAATTPVMVFSMSVAAPNGLEMCAALTVWMSLLGLHNRRGRDDHPQALLLAATIGAVVLTTLRSIGPLWVLLVVGAVLLSLGPRPVVALVRRRATLAGACALVVLTVTVAGVLWTRSAGTNALEPVATTVPNRLTGTLAELPLWFLQGIAAFPGRLGAAPALVYVLVTMVLLTLVGAALLIARRGLRLAMLLIVVLAVAVPVAVTIPTIRTAGAIWQGRYGLPYFLGLSLLAGLALDQGRPRDRRVVPVVGACWLALLVAQVVGALHVLSGELARSPLAHSSAWLRPHPWMVTALMSAGFLVWGAACRASSPREPGSASVWT
ncbi:MAG: DUF2142 domain-containing protein [Nocardioidaceae bacterium]